MMIFYFQMQFEPSLSDINTNWISLIMIGESALFESNETIVYIEPAVDEYPICRICLQPESSGESYCKCRGNIKHVHERCLLLWVEKVEKKKEKQGNSYFKCQICKQRVYLKTTQQCGLRMCKYYCNDNIMPNYQFGVLLFILILSTVVMLVCLLITFNSSEEEILKFILILAGVVACVCVLYLMCRVVIECREVIIGVHARVGRPQNSISNVANAFFIEDL